MGEQSAPDFAGVLRQLREESGLTQEELAGAAMLSPRTVSDLERRIHRSARTDTAGLLADTLGLAGPARGRVPAAQVLAAKADGQAHITAPGLHGFVPALNSFVGRASEVAEAATLVRQCRLVTVTGPGGGREDPAGR